MKIKFEIAKLDLKPGDILAVRLTRKNVLPGDAARIQRMLSEFVGADCKVLVMDNEMELTVVKGATPAPLAGTSPALPLAGTENLAPI
jgi:hypothetical protein